MVVISSQHGPVDCEHIEVWWGQCLQYHIKVNCNNGGDYTPTHYQVILHYLDQGNIECAADPECGKNMSVDHRYMWVEGDFLGQKLLPRFWADFAVLVFDTKYLSGKQRYLLRCPLFLMRNSVLSGFSFSLFIDIRDWTKAKHDCKPLLQQNHLMQRTHKARCHQDGG